MKRWFFTRAFNRFDLVALVLCSVAVEEFGVLAGLLAIFAFCVLSGIGERSLSKDEARSEEVEA